MKNIDTKKRFYIRLFELAAFVVLAWLSVQLLTAVLGKRAIEQLSEITNTEVEAKKISFHINGSILIKDMRISAGHDLNPEKSILIAKNVYARFGLISLLTLKPRLKKLNVKDFVLNVQQDIDENLWNVGTINFSLANADLEHILPCIQLKRGIIKYSRYMDGKIDVLWQMPMSAELNPDKRGEKLCSFEVVTLSENGLNNTLFGRWQEGKFSVSGGVCSLDILSLQRVWSIFDINGELNYDEQGNYYFVLSSEAMKFDKSADEVKTISNNDGTRDGFRLNRLFERFDPSGTADIVLAAKGNLNRLENSEFSGKIFAHGLKITDSKFPYQLENMWGIIHFNNEKIVLDNLTGLHGQNKVAIDGLIDNPYKKPNYNVRFLSDGLALDKDLYDALKPEHQKLWEHFSPSGSAAIDYRLIRNKGIKDSRLDLTLLDADAVFDEFPYRLTNMTGELFFDRKGVEIKNVTSNRDGETICLNGRIDKSALARKKWHVSVNAENINLDNDSIEAFPEGYRDSLRGFVSSGIDLIDSIDGELWYENNGSQALYDLVFTKNNAKFTEPLKQLAGEKIPLIKNKIDINGNADIQLSLRKDSGSDLNYGVKVDFLGSDISLDALPYRFSSVNGTVGYKDGQVNFSGLRGVIADNIELNEHRSNFNLDGSFGLNDGDIVDTEIDLSVSNILFDQRLRSLLPEKIKGYFQELNPSGCFDIVIDDLKIASAANLSRNIDFTAKIKTYDVGFGGFEHFNNINGMFEINASFDKNSRLSECACVFSLDDMSIFKRQFKNIKGHGGYNAETKSWTAENISGRLGEGKVNANSVVSLDSEKGFEYELEAGFEKLDFNNHFEPAENSSLSTHTNELGLISGLLSLCGSAENLTQSGRLTLYAQDFKAGTASPLHRILKAISLSEPSDFIFDKLYLDSYIKSDSLYIQQIDLGGDGVSFTGDGKLDLTNNQLDLVLSTRGRRFITDKPSVLGSLGDNIGQAVLRMKIKGDLLDPVITTEKMPVVKDTLGLFGSSSVKN